MEKKKRRHDEVLVDGSKLIAINRDLYTVSKSVCKIKYGDKVGSGFFIKFKIRNKDFDCLMSNEHVINKESIKAKERINISYDSENKSIQIILNEKLRYIKTFKGLEDLDIDATVVQIIPEDNIIDDYLLLPDKDYMNKNSYETLIKKKVYIPQFPLGTLSYSIGEIKEIDNNEFTHFAATERGSSGSPVFLLNSTKVLGLHKAGNDYDKENYGDFIGPIFDYLNNDIILKKFLVFKKKISINDISSKKDGYGNYKYENGDVYEGNLKNGLPNGKGSLYDKKGNTKFEGNFINGIPNKGTYYYEDGEYYKGHIKNNSANGYGQLYYKNGNLKYEGNFENDIKTGLGKCFYENGEYYEGPFKNNLRHGKGKEFYENDNIKYEGDFSNDMFNGKGKFYTKKGKLKYEGDFVENAFEGKGKFYYNNGNYYIGDMKKGKKHGNGEFYSKDGNIIYEGEYSRDKYEGEGKYVYDDGSHYIGHFKNGLKHGEGTMYDEDGKIQQEGKFYNDEFVEDN